MRNYISSAFLSIILLFVSHPVLADYSTNWVGGQGGINFGGIKCPKGSVIVGLRVGAGNYVDMLQTMCSGVGRRSISGDNFDGDFHGSIPTPAFNLSEKQIFCPKNYRLSGLKVNAGFFIDKIRSLRCTQYRGESVKYVTVNAGGSGGKTQTMYCKASAGDYLTSIAVAQGTYIDRLRGSCR